jgi:predicted Zn-dependent peptidase
VAAVRELVKGFAADGPDESEMESVRRLFSELATKAQRAPRFWARVLSELRYRAGDLDELTDMPTRCLQRTSGQLHRAVAESVRPERRVTVVCNPRGGGEPEFEELKIGN